MRICFWKPCAIRQSNIRVLHSNFYGNYRTLEEENIKKQPYFSISSYTGPRRLAGWLTCDKSARILDFGCSPASFLALARDEFGFENVEGLELNENSAGVASRSYGIKLTPTIEQLKLKTYDVIILLEVIEHLTNPSEVISLCRNLLGLGGQIIHYDAVSAQHTGAIFSISLRALHCAEPREPIHGGSDEPPVVPVQSQDRALETDDAPLLGKYPGNPALQSRFH